MKTDWRMLLDDHPRDGRIILPDCMGDKVYVNLEARDSIYKQLQDLVGKRVVELVPGDKEDWEKYSTRTNLPGEVTDWTPAQHQASRKIGVLTDVTKNVNNYMSPVNDIFAKVETDEVWDDFQWKSYELHIGLDDEWKDNIKPIEFEPYETLDDGYAPTESAWKNGFTIKSCRVRGLYFKRAHNKNDHDFDVRLRNYYHLRELWMYIYLPGRCYW